MLFKLGLRFLWRDWRQGELYIVVLAIIIAVASVTSIGAFNQQIHSSIGLQQTHLLGADLILRSSKPIYKQWQEQAKQLQLQLETTLSFTTMLVAGESLKLANVKAVGHLFPLIGQLKIADAPGQPGRLLKRGPKPGNLWLESRLVHLLNLKINDTVQIGTKTLSLTGILLDAPGEFSYLFAFAPRAMMHRDDIAATQVIQPGSRIQYDILIQGQKAQLEKFKNTIKPQLQPGQRFISSTQSTPVMNNAVLRAERYLGLSSLISVLLAGIAIATAATRYSERHYDYTALISCLGGTPGKILRLYLIQFCIIAFIAGIVGCLIGYSLCYGVNQILANLLPDDLSRPDLKPAMMGLITGFVTLLGCTLPTIARLKTTPPLRVLKRDLQQSGNQYQWLYLLTICLLLSLMYWASQNLSLILVISTACIVLTLMIISLSFIFLKTGEWIMGDFSSAIRFSIRHIMRHLRFSIIQICAISMAIMIIMTVLLVRTDLISDWQQQLPDNAHNHFAINIQPDEINKLGNYLIQENIDHSPLMPMIRGRLTEKNKQPIQQAITEQNRSHNALRRTLNLSWSTQLPDHNQLSQGQWWSDADKSPQISIEVTLAKALNIQIGDHLTFKIADQTIQAKVMNLRIVHWENFKPNFYILFQPGPLTDFPKTYMNSFYLPGNQKNKLNALLHQFPTLTVIETDRIMNNIKQILSQVIAAVEYLAFFVLLASICVLYAAIQASLDERKYNAAIIRTLGASQQFIKKVVLSEFTIIGMTAGIIAAFATELCAAGLYQFVFSIPVTFHLWLWITGTLLGISVVVISGYHIARQIINKPPLVALRE